MTFHGAGRERVARIAATTGATIAACTRRLLRRCVEDGSCLEVREYLTSMRNIFSSDFLTRLLGEGAYSLQQSRRNSKLVSP